MALNDLKLGPKFTVLLLTVFLGGTLLSGASLATILNRSAQDQVTTKALMMMETMNSVREYTNTQVKPELKDRLQTTFLPETVPSYSAREVFETFRANPAYSDFFYKEATLNPTNARDQADEFESTIVQSFRSQPDAPEVHGFRDTPTGEIFYIARPIQIKNATCLECHSSPSVAPASMLKRYGSTGGFNWELNEIVGAQVISVPSSTVLASARQSWLLIMSIVMGVFAIAIFLLNYWLKRYIVRPLTRMAMVAEAVSIGDTDAEFNESSKDEVGQLAQSFNRMRLSLQMAMQRLERYRIGRRSDTPPSQ